ncbi:MAG: serine--tRNA ligase [Acidimicrobiaceae bacterium]|nr:serine--tRNA ligase [Acidimicrobiaceae bacterium]
MIDLRKLRDNENYREGIIRKGVDPEVLDELLAIEAACRDLQAQVEKLRSEQNTASKDIGRAAPAERDKKIKIAAELKSELQEVEVKHTEAAESLNAIAITIPNPADPRCPNGGEEDYEIIEVIGQQTDPPPMDHAEYGEYMGWVEKEKASENMGSRFAYLTREAVLLEFALVQYTLSKILKHGFTPVVPPVLVREQMMLEAGFFPTDRQQVYELSEDDLFLIGTSEVALAGLHRGDLLDSDQLPIRLGGFSSCFRREAGTYGKDTSGIFRVHQFDKVEMFSFCDPLTSWEELENLRGIEQEILNELELPYRVILVASGDLGAPAAMKYDCEVWLPSEGRYRELTSCSNYLDYSARRMMTRVRGEDGNHLVHTLNGTACAIGRTLVFLMEHYQQEDGSFLVPSVLQPFCGLEVIQPPEASS